MAKKKGQGQANKGERPTASDSEPSKTKLETQSKTEANPLKTKASEKSTSSLKTVTKRKQPGGEGGAVNKASGTKEPMNKEKAKDAEKHGPADTIRDVLQFLKEVNIERRKISWPAREQVIRETWSVLVLVVVITFLVLGFDWILGHLVFGPLEHWAHLHGGMGRG